MCAYKSACFVSNNSLVYLHLSQELMDSTVDLDDNGDGGYTAIQMWEAVSKSISYSFDLMHRLFTTVGVSVTHDKKSPFCCSFSSLVNLRDVLISYLPRTFKYNEM